MAPALAAMVPLMAMDGGDCLNLDSQTVKKRVRLTIAAQANERQRLRLCMLMSSAPVEGRRGQGREEGAIQCVAMFFFFFLRRYKIGIKVGITQEELKNDVNQMQQKQLFVKK